MHIVAQKVPPENYALFHPAFLPPFYSFGGLAALLMRNGEENGQSKLCVRDKGVNAVVEKDHADSQLLELPGVENAVQRVAGKTADLLGDDQLKAVILGIRNHTVESGAFLGGGTGDALIDIDFAEFPQRVTFNILSKITFLTFQRICLIVPVGRNLTIGGYPLLFDVFLECAHLR